MTPALRSPAWTCSALRKAFPNLANPNISTFLGRLQDNRGAGINRIDYVISKGGPNPTATK